MTFKYTKTGTCHEICQDEVLAVMARGNVFLALADGAGQCAHSARGAWIACYAGTDYLRRNRNSLKDFSDEKTAYLLTEQVQNRQKFCALQADNPPESYSSTLMLGWIEAGTNDAVLYCMGDGTAALIRNKQLHPLFPGDAQAGCPLTFTENAYKAMKIIRVKLEKSDILFFCSDGMQELLKDPQLGTAARRALEAGDFQSLAAQTDGAETADDCSYIAWRVD